MDAILGSTQVSSSASAARSRRSKRSTICCCLTARLPSASCKQRPSFTHSGCSFPLPWTFWPSTERSACLETAQNMNEFYNNTDVRAVALLPVMVDRRLQATKMTLEMLDKIAAKYELEVLPGIRTDQAVQRANRGKSFLADHDPRSKALEDYAAAAGRLAEIMNVNTPIEPPCPRGTSRGRGARRRGIVRRSGCRAQDRAGRGNSPPKAWC